MLGPNTITSIWDLPRNLHLLDVEGHIQLCINNFAAEIKAFKSNLPGLYFTDINVLIMWCFYNTEIVQRLFIMCLALTVILSNLIVVGTEHEVIVLNIK